MTEQTRTLADLIAQGTIEAPPRQLNQEEKENLAASGQSFDVNSIQLGDDGDFGPYWQFDVMLDGKKTTFRLSSNEKRDDWISTLAAATQSGPISGVRLRAISTRGGNKFLVVEPA